ncbi:MAG: energy transducer TonB [Bacteroidota bacterium]
MRYYKILIVFYLLLSGGFCLCQQNETKSDNHDTIEIINALSTWPSFPGGENQLYCFYYHNVDTVKLRKNNKAGIIYSQFVVDTTGEISNLKILRGIDPIADNEFIRLIRLMPPWVPGMQGNKKVKVIFNLSLKLPYENKFCH